MARHFFVFAVLGFLVGCAELGFFQPKSEAASPGESNSEPKNQPVVSTEAGGLNSGGLQADDIAQVPEADIARASSPTSGGQILGTTTATLGLLERDGIWVATPLVSDQRVGRVVVVATGTSANVTLLPNGGVAGSGSQISVAAMQILGVQLTDIITIKVFAK